MSWLLRATAGTYLIFGQRDPHGHAFVAWLVFVTATYCTVLATRQARWKWAGAMACTAALYNPFWSPDFSHQTWMPLGFVVALVLLGSFNGISDPAERIPLAQATFFTGLALIVIGYVAFGLVRFVWLASMGVPASAVVEHAFDDERESRDRVATVTTAVYRFAVSGRTYRGKTTGPEGAWDVGDTLTIEYDPLDPRNNRAAGDRQRLGDLFTVGVFGGVGAFIVWKSEVPHILRWWQAGRKHPAEG